MESGTIEYHDSESLESLLHGYRTLHLVMTAHALDFHEETYSRNHFLSRQWARPLILNTWGTK